MNELIERVADLLHQIWIEDSKSLCKDQYYDIPTHIRNFWARSWKPYNELPKNEKGKYRIVAKRFVDLLER